MLGGLARRVTWVERERAAGKPMVVVDSGDLFFDGRPKEDPKKDLAKAEIIARAFRKMGPTAMNVGDLDLFQGLDFLKRVAAEGLPLISSNLLMRADQSPVFPPYLIREVAGLRIAFLGLLPPHLSFPGSASLEEKIMVKNPMEAARETMPKILGKADLVILLSDLGMNQDFSLVQAISGIDFVLGGHEGRFMGRPNQQGKTYTFQSANKGMYAGKLGLTIEGLPGPFQDMGKPDYILKDIQGIDRQIRYYQQEKTRQPKENIDRSLQQLNDRKSNLQKELKQAKDSAVKGNRFLWTLQTMEASIPEDPEVRKWIEETGIQKD